MGGVIDSLVVFRNQCRLTITALALVCGTSFAQQPAKSDQQVRQSVERPPLPPPSEEQVRRGRELIDKIAYVVAKVPLTDALAVLKVFGFSDIGFSEYPTYVRAAPKNKDGGYALPEALSGTGLLSINVVPLILDEKSDSSARLSMRFAVPEACVLLDDVRKIFAPKSQKISTLPVFYIDDMRLHKRSSDVGYLDFYFLDTPLGKNGTAEVMFDYEVCAKDFVFVYEKVGDK